MGKRGPKRTPKAILQLRNSWRANEPRRKNEPKFAGPAPKQPRGMGRIAAAEWKRVVRQLDALGIVKEVDRSALEAYCTWYERYRAEAAALKRKKIGTTEYSRVHSAMSTSYQNMMKAAACFGMTPADRSRVDAGDGQQDKPADPLDEYLGDGKKAKSSKAG